MGSGQPFQRILVGVDGSDASLEALRQGHMLAAALQAEVDATAYWDYPQAYAGYVAVGFEEFEEEARAVLRKAMAAAFDGDTPSNVHPHLVRGHPRDALIEASRHADLVVVGKRGHGGFGGMLLGSVTSALVAHAHCPVLVVHTPETNPHG
ncbi:universal stress protein [Pseudarthrobacter sp. NPDC092424]|uniref:universal stress protein n=1 Tax=Pseudarthrobacter sp. NPDC092424 TaxID=3364415 RepID=UPI0038152AD5